MNPSNSPKNLSRTWQVKLGGFLYNFLDFLYPRRCVGCGEEGVWLCANCQLSIVKVQTPTCFFCQTITENGKTCPRCRAHHALTGVVVFGYHEGVLKEAIRALKYDFVHELAEPLGSLLASTVYAQFANSKVEIIPIPLSRRRLAQRGFNQSELLARAVARRLGLSMNTELIRVKNVIPQTELSGAARRKNMAGAFAWKGRNLSGKTVLLIDDVATTGTTLDEGSKVLREAGAKIVWGAVVAKG